jgi:nitroimidazol reductase NimA-like FMN-containing flavoprotein (pyridoxamine 5'-phosphate oxidase superfamily)
MPPLSPDVRFVLAHSFVIRTTMIRRSDGMPRTVETTYVWDGGHRVYLSGYPGKRDWVASMAANPQVTLHTVELPEGGEWFDIPATARVLRNHRERTHHVLAFIDRWTQRQGSPSRPFQLALAMLKLNRRLHLPWWGPFYLARRVLDRMPCVELTFTGEPTVRPGGPPPLSNPQSRA